MAVPAWYLFQVLITSMLFSEFNILLSDTAGDLNKILLFNVLVLWYKFKLRIYLWVIYWYQHIDVLMVSISL